MKPEVRRYMLSIWRECVDPQTGEGDATALGERAILQFPKEDEDDIFEESAKIMDAKAPQRFASLLRLAAATEAGPARTRLLSVLSGD